MLARYAVLITEDAGGHVFHRDPPGSGSWGHFTYPDRHARFLEDCDAHAAIFEKFDDAAHAVWDELKRLGVEAGLRESALYQLERSSFANSQYIRGSSRISLFIEVLNLVPHRFVREVIAQFDERDGD